MSALDLGLLRQVALTGFDLNVIRTLVKTGGEAPNYPAGMKPEVRALLQITIDKGLITATGDDGLPASVTTTNKRVTLRFTDLGRRAAAQDAAAMQAAQTPTVRA